ncbi:hypothetical protein BC332_18729 [Capsicum chinense]|nr:hypothetical protein BC332_18729 [Capsicum chinense]
MFQEVEVSSSSIIEQLVEKNNEFVEDNFELGNVLELAGMVFVQSLKELGRCILIFYNNNNNSIPSKIPQVRSGEGKVYSDRTTTSGLPQAVREAISEKPSAQTVANPAEMPYIELLQCMRIIGQTHELYFRLSLYLDMILDGLSTEVQKILEKFLRKWRYVDGKYYTFSSMEADVPDMEEFSNQISVGVNTYLEIIGLYVIAFFGEDSRKFGSYYLLG